MVLYNTMFAHDLQVSMCDASTYSLQLSWFSYISAIWGMR